MQDPEFEYDSGIEEIDLEEEGVELVEDTPDFASSQADEHGNQDELEEGEALGDDLAPAQPKGDDPDA